MFRGEAMGSSRRPLLATCDGLDALLAVIAGFHIFMAPYTKVEESFNTQAIHDLLYHQQHIEKYDHLVFPGVVPRTFLGSILVSVLASPFVTLINFLHLPKIYSLYVVRLVLGSITLVSIHLMRLEVRKQFGSRVSNAFALITAMQFHLLFYCSRPLPNIFALACVTLAYHFWIRNCPRSTLRMLVFSMIVFRCDVVLILGPIGLSLLWARAISFWDAIKCCFSTALVSTVLTFTVDSIMWRRWVWPEWEVFWFNSVLDRSSEWGVSPFYWYFTSALPRAMLAAFPLALLGLAMERRLWQFLLPVLGFIVLYSKLPHKELRFILFAIPMLNLAAAAAVARIYNNRKKQLWSIIWGGCVLLFLASLCYTTISAAASYANYPGGHAMASLYNRDDLSKDVDRVVHVDVLPAMTGVSRFCERGSPWSYSKQEGLTPDALSTGNFTYLLNARSTIPAFKCLMAVNGFSRVSVQLSFPPVVLVTEPKVYILGSEEYQWTTTWPGCSN